MLLAPNPHDETLARPVTGVDQDGREVEIRVVTETPISVWLNGREVVTLMTIGDHPELLALGYLMNQNILAKDDPVDEILFDAETAAVVVRSEAVAPFEAKMEKRIRTSGCAQGTVFGDAFSAFEKVRLPGAELRTSWLFALTRAINTTPSLYLEAGAIHGCVLCHRNRPLAYMEDVGRHNAVDKIAGWMRREKIDPADKIFYTTGRLTSEMVMKCAMMGVPVLVSRSGFTAWGVELARQVGLTLVGRARGHRFTVLSGAENIVRDANSDIGEAA